MKVTDFSQLVAIKEDGKIQVSIAQIKEILKETNILLDGELYKMIRKLGN